VLNWGKQTNVSWAAERLNGRMCLMGNVSPLELGVQGTPEQVYAASREVLEQAGGHPLILSLGGAVTIGMPPANVRAMAKAVADFNR
jgi:uroporphyrinogen decarboxylase